MKKKEQPQGVHFNGSLRQDGITFYQRGSKTIMRSAHSYQKRSCTRKQFIQRQRMRHSQALWKTFRYCEMMFTEHENVYLGFASIANRLPPVFVTKDEAGRFLSLLMPGIPVSEGTMTSIDQHLGEVNGVAALLTDLKLGSSIKSWDTFWLYTAEQGERYGVPSVSFSMRTVKVTEMTQTETGLALVGEEYADENKGWALVHVSKDRCSTQGIVTRCTLYQKYTTEEVMLAAAESYGGLTQETYWYPRR